MSPSIPAALRPVMKRRQLYQAIQTALLLQRLSNMLIASNAKLAETPAPSDFPAPNLPA